ncbi:hypothetical protein J5N97_006974 [Dioscorea zingiberensis]|uniref:Peptidase C14 caspase domain-containing protein n=1 Tax=Dioscorea zingiberensis TaxID=325984 RepID=A0A9D5DB06_9LILI|nr:hypothetical protein J5N97_006974 [Dioscorea zingiberensis]
MSSRARAQSCNGCGETLLVPHHARTMRCSRCRSLTSVHSFFPAALGSPRVLTSSNYSSYTNSQQPSGRTYDDEGLRLANFPRVTGKKRALLIGVSYIGKRYELKGTINDVNCMKYFLVHHFDFSENSIVVLTEEEDPSRIPTRRNMEAAMRWLTSDVSSGHSLVFHFSGHGSQRRCVKDDEPDGFDETLCPVDYEKEGMIVDDDINEILVRPLPTGARLHAIVDSCHSGTVLDLPFLCKMGRSGSFQWEEQQTGSSAYKGTNGGLAISFSGCDDHQTSADTSVLSKNVATGAMTYCFIQAVISEPGSSYGSILSAMHSAIRNADGPLRVRGPIAALLKKVFKCRLDQEPMLASSEKFDIYRKPFIL